MKQNNLSGIDMARISLTMQGAHAVYDLLLAGEDYAESDLDALATTISDGDPEEVMVMLACSASHISNFGTLDPQIRLSLRMTAGNILEDYAPSTFKGSKSSEIDCDAQLDAMQEDFEMFSELFAMIADLSAPHTAQHHVCLVLADQALAQAEAIDYVDNDFCDERDLLPVANDIIYSGNVIPFPVVFRQR